MADTLTYYSREAPTFFESTVSVDLSTLYEPFLARIPTGGLILDLGCGSGRDTKAFLDRGYRVHAIDACPELVAMAKAHADNTKQATIEHGTFDELAAESKYDAIWACASFTSSVRDFLDPIKKSSSCANLVILGFKREAIK